MTHDDEADLPDVEFHGTMLGREARDHLRKIGKGRISRGMDTVINRSIEMGKLARGQHILFPNAHADADTDRGVIFEADDNGKRRLCIISREALEDHFDARSGRPEHLLSAFLRNSIVIEAMARLRLVSSTEDRVVLRTMDFVRMKRQGA
jgi:hypothetical protein